jgi:hypothetical protein
MMDSDAKSSKGTLASRKYISWKKLMEIDKRGLITSGEDDLGRLEELGTEGESETERSGSLEERKKLRERELELSTAGADQAKRKHTTFRQFWGV